MALQIRRLLRHWLAPARSKILSDQALQRLSERIRESERLHSAEICICVEARLPERYLRLDAAPAEVVRQRAIQQFGKLRVWDTEDNNGVLIYLLLVDRAIEIVADRGLNQRVPQATWKAIIDSLATDLRQGQFEAGLARAVEQIGTLMHTHFPLQDGARNPNELADYPTDAAH